MKPHENHYAVRIEYDDGDWVATVPTLPGCMCVAPGRDAAQKEIRVLIRGVLDLMEKDGVPIPAPDSFPRVGEIRRIGEFGPTYVIEKISDDTCTVSVPENGQKAELKLESVLADPIEV